ncbi:MAG: DUF3810 domain-containing protein [Ruminococcus sp.]|nr:DUF3810 domain-containing protein [Ruminococcus sp.]
MVRKKLGKQLTVILIIYAACIFLNILARVSTSFADWYGEHIFPFWVNAIGRPIALLPFSLGEIMIIAAIVIILLTVPALTVLLIVLKGRRKLVLKVCGFIYAWIIAFILVTETLNCFILYQRSTFGEIYNIPTTEHTNAELLDLCSYLTVNTNELSKQVKRDEKGKFILTADLDETARYAMAALGDEFPQLAGYYVTPKPIINSYFMSQQYMMGIYFPFSLEANYNSQMYPSNLPETVCHELAHTKGFMLEDEANFIAFLACARCSHPDYQYSGYLRALKYVLSQVKDNCTDEEISEVYGALAYEVAVDINGNSSYWRSVQESDEGLLPSKTVAKISDSAMEASLKFNGVKDGKKSYGRMVDLLLDYGIGKQDK